jgi:hypothetical protein
MSYLQMILEGFWQMRDDTIKEAKMTPQIAYLEHLLNDRYGRTDIFISDGFELGPWIFSTEEEADPEFYMDQEDDSYIYSTDDQVTVSFVVNIPEVLSEEVQSIAAMVQKYKLAGKYFIIQIF